MQRPLLLLLIGSACAPPPEIPAEPRPEVVLSTVMMRAYQGSAITAVGRADRLAYERSSSNVEAEQVLLQLPSRSRVGGQYAQLGGLRIGAPRADGNLATQHVEASGGVELLTGSGVAAATPRASFDGTAQIVSGTERLVVKGPAYALDARGFMLRAADEDFVFDGPLRSGLGRPR